jgi:hypothetical protein
MDVGVGPVLHHPAGGHEHPVDDPPGLRLGEPGTARGRGLLDVVVAQASVDGRRRLGPGGQLLLQVGNPAGQLLHQPAETVLRLNGLPDRGIRRRLRRRLGVRPVLLDGGLHLHELGLVAVEQLPELGGRVLRRTGRLGRDERRSVPEAGHRLVEPGAQLVAGAQEEQRVPLRGVVLVRGLVADPADAVEPAVRPSGDEPLVAKDPEALELFVGHRRDAELKERPLGQRPPRTAGT